MRKRFTLSVLLFVCFFFVTHSTTLAAQNLPYETVSVNGQTFYKYNVKKSEGLYAISRTFSVSVEDIKKYNPSAKEGLKNGQELLIPAKRTTKSSTPQSVNSLQNPNDQNNTFRHTVERGETVFSIAKMYNTSVEEINRLNPGVSETIVVGQTLVIPQRKTISEVKEDNYRYHTISAGETLYAVSRTYKLKPEDVVTANPGLSAETFKAGETIRIPFFESSETFVPYKDQVQNIQHTVKRKETLFSLAQQYNVSQDDIRKANPSLSGEKSLKAGTTLQIPLKTSIIDNTQDKLVLENKAKLLLQKAKSSLKVDVLKVGFLMPFLDNRDNNNTRIQEYYEGFLMGVLKMKEDGANIEVYTFDIGTEQDTRKLESLLGTIEMQSLNLVIGGFYDSQIKIISDFAKMQNIKYVIPLPTKSTDVLNNGDVFQVITPQSYFYTKASNVFLNTFKKANVIIASSAGNNDKDEFIDILKNDLKQNNIKYSIVPIDDNFEATASSLLDLSRENVIVPTTGESAPLRKILNGLKSIHNDNPGYITRLFGYPEWQTYNSSFRQDYHLFGTYLYSYFYADEKDESVRNFNADFKKWYKRDLMNTYPRFGMLGYDTAIYFLSAMKKFGVNFEEDLNKVNVNTLQFAFHFERVNNWSGFINTGLYLVYYEPNSDNVLKFDRSR